MAHTKTLKQSIMRILLSGLILQATMLICAQTPASFAGKWQIDHARSDAEFRDYQITCNIEQTPAAITVTQIFLTNDGKESSMPPITFSLDGKELSGEEQGGINRISAELSADRKILTTKYIRTMNGSEYGSITVYSLSDDGRILTVKTSDLNNESQLVQVYIRK